MEKELVYKNAIFCEEARLDMSGRPLMIGVIPEHIRAFSLPVKIGKSFLFTEVFTKGRKVETFVFSIKNPLGEELTRSVTAVSVGDWALPFSLIVEFSAIELSSEGKYTICNNDEVLREINVSKAEEQKELKSKESDNFLLEEKIREILKEALENASPKRKK